MCMRLAFRIGCLLLSHAMKFIIVFADIFLQSLSNTRLFVPQWIGSQIRHFLFGAALMRQNVPCLSVPLFLIRRKLFRYFDFSQAYELGVAADVLLECAMCHDDLLSTLLRDAKTLCAGSGRRGGSPC